VGETDHADLLQILDEFEESIKDDIPALDAKFDRYIYIYICISKLEP
jgi:hypothetical protein